MSSNRSAVKPREFEKCRKQSKERARSSTRDFIREYDAQVAVHRDKFL